MCSNSSVLPRSPPPLQNSFGKSEYQPFPVHVPLALKAKLYVPLDLESEIACPFSESASYIIHVDVYYSHENKHVYLCYHRKTFLIKKNPPPPKLTICALKFTKYISRTYAQNHCYWARRVKMSTVLMGCESISQIYVRR
jgi:hypothetical protein